MQNLSEGLWKKKFFFGQKSQKKKKESKMKWKSLTLLAALLSGCATTTSSFEQYQFYVLDLEGQKLNGKSEKDDLPLSECLDSGASKANCYVLKRNEYIKLKGDLAELKLLLDACEAQ